MLRIYAIRDRTQNKLGQLVLKPLRSLKGASNFVKKHEKNDYHLLLTTQVEQFIKTCSDPDTSIDRILDKEDKDQIITNQKVLTIIIKCILFLAKQNLAFRGNDDHVDETSNVRETEQLSPAERYLSWKYDGVEVKEDFIGFIPLHAAGISDKIMEFIRAAGLDLFYLRDTKCSKLVIRSVDKMRSLCTFRSHSIEFQYDKLKLDELQNDLKQFSRDNNVELKISRTSKHKTVELYLKHIYETFIQTTLDQLSYRFSEHQKIVVKIMTLIPVYVVDRTVYTILKIR
ncbi:unnamed protein product [Didymodactylos carnosus]|uniref:Uncharacterized protein n=1 Tax=Didymodactylos carnosus TaxID=1234261 RepID=A0A8S2DZT9_9BILA|nr:unnamed protein product [Didymodactylos carnosus]CAF3796180.1 unnamed protein product [Didymodactylos carnosus]